MKKVTYKCDKCSKDITEHGIVVQVNFRNIHEGKVSDNSENPMTMDLCVECKKKAVNQLKEINT